MRQGGEPQGVQIVRQGEPTPYHCNFNRLYCETHLGMPSGHLATTVLNHYLIYINNHNVMKI